MAYTRIQWTKEMTLRLIEEYRKEPVLWDPTQTFYHSKFNRDLAWNKISVALGVPFQTCRYKLDSLLATFRRECRQELATSGINQKSNTGASHMYPQLLFLKKLVMQKILRQSRVLRPSTKNKKLKSKKDNETRNTHRNVLNNSIEIGNDSATNINCESASTIPEITFISAHIANHPQKPSELQEADIEAIKALQQVQVYDEVEAFTEFVHVKMKNYSLSKIREVQQEICEILLKVESV